MKRLYFIFSLLFLWSMGFAVAQDHQIGSQATVAEASGTLALEVAPEAEALALLIPALPSFDLSAPLPRLGPEFALETYERHAAMQSAELVSYSSITVIRAELPQSSQYGEFELQRHYSAPRTLQFKAVRFIGDNFVKSNIIVRLLQSEVDHVQKDDTARTSLNRENYKFSYKGINQINGRQVLVYQVKPHKKQAGLFKGRVSLDSYSGRLVRVEGSVVKSPSLFIRRIDFTQDYEDFGEFTFPVHTHSEAQTRLVGRTVVDILQSDYQPVTTPKVAAGIPAL
jgi:hypothetical protein